MIVAEFFHCLVLRAYLSYDLNVLINGGARSAMAEKYVFYFRANASDLLRNNKA